MRKTITSDRIHTLAEYAQVQSGWITQVAWSPNGSALAVAGAQGVNLFSGEFGGEPTHVLEGHDGHVKGVAFSPYRQDDGTPTLYIASCASDMVIKLWDGSNLKGAISAKTTLTEQTDSVDYIVFGPRFSSHPRARLTLVACCADGTINIYDVETKTRSAVLTGHTAEVTSATFGLDGHILISASRDNTLRLWDVQNETGGALLGKHEDWIRHVQISPSGTLVASASKDTTVRLWDVYSGDLSATIQAHQDGADCVAFSPDGKLLATGGRDNVVRIWDVSQALTQETLTADDALVVINAHEKPVLSVAFNPTGTLLASASGDNRVKLWGVNDDGEKTDFLTGAKTTPLEDLR